MGKVNCLNCSTKFKGSVETPCPSCEWSIWGYSVEHDDPSFFLEQEKTLRGFWTAYKVLGIAAVIVTVIILGARFLGEPEEDIKPINSPTQSLPGVHASVSPNTLYTFEGV